MPLTAAAGRRRLAANGWDGLGSGGNMALARWFNARVPSLRALWPGMHRYHFVSALRILQCLLAGAMFCVPSWAKAGETFSPFQCSSCNTWQEVDFKYKSTGSIANDYDHASQPNCTSSCPRYINNLEDYRFVYANKYVDKLEFRLASFETEVNYDFLKYREAGGTYSVLHGSPSLTWYGIASSSVLQENPMQLALTTDRSVNYAGFHIDKVRVCCQTSAGSATPSANMELGVRYQGVLLAQHDVVMFTVPAPAANQELNLAMWGAGTDFDLYARCNAVPTETNFDAAARSGDSREFLNMSTSCGSPGVWYVAVQAYSGTGQFNLVASHMRSDKNISVWRAGTDFNASQLQMNSFRDQLLLSARQFYGQTEGQVLIRDQHLYNSNGCGPTACGGNACDVCFKNVSGTGFAPCESYVDIMQSYFGDVEGLAHEYGHYFFCVYDEYIPDTTIDNCGHSNMANPWGPNNNFCTGHNHELDRDSGATDTGLDSVWATVWTAGDKIVTNTGRNQDNYDYVAHDFNGVINVTVH